MCKYQCIEHCSAEPNCIIDISGTHPKSYPDMCPIAGGDHDYITWIAVEPKTPKTVERNDSAAIALLQKVWNGETTNKGKKGLLMEIRTFLDSIAQQPCPDGENNTPQPKISLNIIERLNAVQCIVSSACDEEEAKSAYDELDVIIAQLSGGA